MMQIESSTVTESDIAPDIFDRLYSKYNETLSCPCSITSISYKNFVSNTIKLHPVCSSRFVSEEWIHALYLSNASRYGVSDFRTTASSQFEILSSFCSLAQDIVDHTKNDVGSEEFVTIDLLSDEQVQHEVDVIIESFKNSASARMIMFLDYFRSTIRGNYLISALNTNLIVEIPYNFSVRMYTILNPTMYTHTDGSILTCSRDNPTDAAILSPVLYESDSSYLNINFKDLSNSTIVSGFFAGCTPLEALLRSTLDCFLYGGLIMILRLTASFTLSFILHEIKQINSTSISCVCATDPDCQTAAVVYYSGSSVISDEAINIIYKLPGFIRGCLNSDSLLQSTLQCLYPESNSDCFANLMTYTKTSYGTYNLNISAVDLHPLVYNPTSSHFPPNTLISTIFKEMMLEQWNSSASYEQFYESCAPKYCTYHQKIRTKTIVDILITLLSMIGGLAVSLHLITPHFVKFLFNLRVMIPKRKQQQQQQQGNH
ncbi:unnamed protein product [Adineta steineri]|uniref:Uncharacterized protein n=1 Tax=Adineta steineri TaxID=433720 RepID=A0A818WYP8_9BILA|nr:unnamed protein product [Adineta steineri]